MWWTRISARNAFALRRIAPSTTLPALLRQRGFPMIRALLQTTSLVFALSTGAAFANEARVLDGSPIAADPGSTYGAASVSFESMEMPDHGNGTIQFDFDGVGDVSPQVSAPMSKAWAGRSVFRTISPAAGVLAASCAAPRRTAMPPPHSTFRDSTPFRHGLLSGVQNGAGIYGGDATADQDLSVDYEALFGTLTYGLISAAGAATPCSPSAAKRPSIETPSSTGSGELHDTDTDFDVTAIELAAALPRALRCRRASIWCRRSLGASFSSIDMDANTLRNTGRFDHNVLRASRWSEDDVAVGRRPSPAASTGHSCRLFPCRSTPAGPSTAPRRATSRRTTSTPRPPRSDRRKPPATTPAVRLGSTW